MLIIPNFAVLEGGDGSGTTTQLERIRSRFVPAGEGIHGSPGENPRRAALLPRQGEPSLPPLHGTFEPTNGPVGVLIRKALGGELPLLPETLARLFSADRQEHIHGPDGIAERCGRGELVISDRYTPSSLVYQGITCGEDLPRALNAPFPGPELLFFLDVDPDIAVKRLENRPVREIFEYRDFQIMVRQRYRELLPRYADQGVRVITIDASQSPETVGEEVWNELTKMPIFKGEKF